MKTLPSSSGLNCTKCFQAYQYGKVDESRTQAIYAACATIFDGMIDHKLSLGKGKGLSAECNEIIELAETTLFLVRKDRIQAIGYEFEVFVQAAFNGLVEDLLYSDKTCTKQLTDEPTYQQCVSKMTQRLLKWLRRKNEWKYYVERRIEFDYHRFISYFDTDSLERLMKKSVPSFRQVFKDGSPRYHLVVQLVTTVLSILRSSEQVGSE